MQEAAAAPTHSSANLARLEMEHLERFGTYTRLFFEDRSYTNLDEFRFAGALSRLLHEYGVRAADRVLVTMPNSPELTAAFPAIWTGTDSLLPSLPKNNSGKIAKRELREKLAAEGLET